MRFISSYSSLEDIIMKLVKRMSGGRLFFISHQINVAILGKKCCKCFGWGYRMCESLTLNQGFIDVTIIHYNFSYHVKLDIDTRWNGFGMFVSVCCY